VIWTVVKQICEDYYSTWSTEQWIVDMGCFSPISRLRRYRSFSASVLEARVIIAVVPTDQFESLRTVCSVKMQMRATLQVQGQMKVIYRSRCSSTNGV